MRTTSSRFMAVVGVVALTVGIGSAIAAESDGAADDEELVVSAVDDGLVERLLQLEPSLPEPLPSAATLADDGVDALLTGSFTSARSTFDSLEEDLRALFVDADEATTTPGDAVSDVAYGLLLERQALLVLEETDSSDSTRPLDVSDARDDAGNAIDADGPYGRLQTALEVLLQGRDLQRRGYEVLAELPAGVDENGVFADRYAALVADRDGAEVTLRQIASTDTTQLLVEIERYDAPIGVARSLSVTYVCVDREAYATLVDATDVARIAGSIVQPDASCRDAARRAGLSLSEQVAVDELLDGVTTAVGIG